MKVVGRDVPEGSRRRLLQELKRRRELGTADRAVFVANISSAEDKREELTLPC